MLQDSTNSWKAFSASCWVWKHFSLQIVVEMIEVVVGWWEVRWIWQMRQNFIVQFVQLLKHWLCNHVVRRCHAKNWAHSVDLCWLQMLLFSVHLTDLLSILFRCYDFARIQKVVVDQMGSRPPNSDHDNFLVHVWLWEVVWSFFSV